MKATWIDDKHRDWNAAAARWAADRIWPGRPDKGFDNYRCMVVDHNADIAAVVVAHNWDPVAGVIELSGAARRDNVGKRWLTRPVIQAMYGYVFDKCGCQMLVQRISEHDKAMHRIFETVGYDQVYIPRLRGRLEGEYIATLTVEQWEKSRFNGVAVSRAKNDIPENA